MSNLDASRFITVDLEIFSRQDLKPLVDALSPKLSVSYLDEEFNLNKAYLGWVWPQFKSPEDGILRICRLVQRLGAAEQKLWDSAKSRSFDIGFSSPSKETYYWSAISSKAIRAAAELNIQIAITIYGPMKTAKSKKPKPA
jgi:hypothetical protein